MTGLLPTIPRLWQDITSASNSPSSMLSLRAAMTPSSPATMSAMLTKVVATVPTSATLSQGTWAWSRVSTRFIVRKEDTACRIN